MEGVNGAASKFSYNFHNTKEVHLQKLSWECLLTDLGIVHSQFSDQCTRSVINPIVLLQQGQLQLQFLDLALEFEFITSSTVSPVVGSKRCCLSLFLRSVQCKNMKFM